jgi:hypothetical protein
MKKALMLAVSGLLIASPAWAGSLSVSGSIGASAGVSAGGGGIGIGGHAGVGASAGASGSAGAGSLGANVAGGVGADGTLRTQRDGSQLLVITNFNKRANLNATSEQVSTASDAEASGEATATVGSN